jgi:hypothetical protein
VSTALVLPPGIRLGKKPPVYDRRTLAFPRFVEKRKLPVVPQTHNLSRKTLKAFPKLGMMLNDKKGDCTVAAPGHMKQTHSVYGGAPWCPTDEQINEAYNRVNGGVDNGAAMLDVLKMLRKDGLGGDRIYAFVAVDPHDHDQVRTAAFLFGGLYVGANLPWNVVDAMMLGIKKEWDDVGGNGSEPGSGGGHAVNLIDYSRRGPTIVTWGELQPLTWSWWDHYIDELYAILDVRYIGDDKRSPQGFSLAKLDADLKGLAA